MPADDFEQPLVINFRERLSELILSKKTQVSQQLAKPDAA